MKRLPLATGRARYARQALLVGSEGQARLSQAVAPLGATGRAREVEEAYLRLAGVRVGGPVGASTADAPLPIDLGLRHASAREVGEGALRALVTMRAILELP